MFRVLVVDDSPVARDLLVGILASDPEIEVVGTACNGAQGVALVERLRPDVVTMDVQMPGVDGYTATREIMTRFPTPIVIVSGSTSRPDVAKSMAALEAGALTLLGKPSSPRSSRFEAEADRLVRMVKAMAGVKVVRKLGRRGPELVDAVGDPASPNRAAGAATRLVAIVASTGGPQVLRTILEPLPADYPIPIAVVQHIALGFTEGFAEWLDGAIPLAVRVARDGEPLTGGSVLFGAENRHLGILSGPAVELLDRPPVGGFRPSGNVLFDTAGRVLDRGVLALILTGMGSDGVDGLRTVRRAGGRILAQSPETCIVDGMPAAAIAAGLVDRVAAPAELAATLLDVGARAPSGGAA